MKLYVLKSHGVYQYAYNNYHAIMQRQKIYLTLYFLLIGSYYSRLQVNEVQIFAKKPCI